jgi:cysteine desulfurase
MCVRRRRNRCAAPQAPGSKECKAMASSTRVYFDNNASAPLLDCVKQAVLSAMDSGLGNAGSTHSAGTRARAAVDKARRQVASLAGCLPEQVLFCSSGTEANNLVLKGIAEQGDSAPVIVTSQIEHSSVLTTCRWLETRGVKVVYSPVHRDGTVDIEFIEAALRRSPALLCIQWVNNETGVVQPIRELASLCERFGAAFHCDATQALGKLSFDDRLSPVNFVTVSAHKIHGPAGIGAVIAHDASHLRPLIHGGDQERGLRAGTENILGIVGFGAAAEHRQQEFGAILGHMRSVRDRFESRICDLTGEVTVNGAACSRVVNTSNVMFAPLDGAALTAQLDARDIYCSQSSACTNSRPEPSYVLRAMGLTEDQAYSSVRFSFSELNSIAEVDAATTAIAEICERLRVALGI